MADVDVVSNAYWRSHQLILFNNNGTVTKGWEQMRKNREASQPDVKDVRLDVRDLHVQMLGGGAALVTGLWTQSQAYQGTSESATGRMTLVFLKIDGNLKVVHLHTSPDAKVNQTSEIEKGAADVSSALVVPPKRKLQPDASNRDDVIRAFNRFSEGIRMADVDVVSNAYWRSHQLILFNNNGTVTRGWEQVRKNREASYPDLKDVRFDVRDLHVQMLGGDAALATGLWTQTQTFRGTAETATGRVTLVFHLVDSQWRIVHSHISPGPLP